MRWELKGPLGEISGGLSFVTFPLYSNESEWV